MTKYNWDITHILTYIQLKYDQHIIIILQLIKSHSIWIRYLLRIIIYDGYNQHINQNKKIMIIY